MNSQQKERNLRYFTFRDYVDRYYPAVYRIPTKSHFWKSIQVVPRLCGDTLRDAFLELVFLFILIGVLMFMSQGKDIITSFFERNGLYGTPRVIFTILTIILFS